MSTKRNRDAKGRFAPGNKIAKRGWAALVAQRFGGDHVAAKTWLGQIGCHSYATQALGGTCLEWKINAVWPHPGDPETFLAQWNAQLDFTLDDVEAVII